MITEITIRWVFENKILSVVGFLIGMCGLCSILAYGVGFKDGNKQANDNFNNDFLKDDQ